MIRSFIAMTLVACATPGAGPGEGGKGFEDTSSTGFAFNESPLDSFTLQTDHLGVSLISTTLRGRSDGYNCSSVNNQLQLLPLYFGETTESGHAIPGLVGIQRLWADELTTPVSEGGPGLTTCNIDGNGVPTEDNILDYLATVPCTTQRVYRRFPDGEVIGGMRVLDLITPDHVTIDTDVRAGFPNGRHPSDQVTDLIVALLTEIDEDHTIDQVTLNPPANDVPFLEVFPYLAPPHPAPYLGGG